MSFSRFSFSVFAAFVLLGTTLLAADLRVGVFDVDVSPPVGSPLAYNRCDAVAMPLQATGIVLVGADDPIVLCAVDWIGIANSAHQQWCARIAEAVGTSADRVSVHTLHQHDAPICDFAADAVLAEYGLNGTMFDVKYAQDCIERVAAAAKHAMQTASDFTHIGIGEAKVEMVASNRRILGEDGKVRATRYTACRDPELRAEPEGTIDPMLKSISFWNGEQVLAVITYYATHPQSYYLKGIANPDFPGMARHLRQVTLNGIPHVHFNGAGGNIGAGKYNDGSPENRQVLAVRMANAMSAAFQKTERHEVSASSVSWNTAPIVFPAGEHLNEESLRAEIGDTNAQEIDRKEAARNLVWLRRCGQNDALTVSCLRIGPATIVHMPGEAVVEYQLYAQQLGGDAFTAVAAYGDYAPGYVCLTEHYAQGGYEASPRASRVSPECEPRLKEAIRAAMNIETSR
ncbi:MAG: hypothetical protein KDB27_26490 [Planctomycetales bacterium]|nr:hypothetical protein [Planctomycetales bacterium]